MPSPSNTVRRPEFFEVGAVATAARCSACTARLLMLSLHERGVPGFFRVDNGNIIADRTGVVTATTALTAQREQSRRLLKRRGKRR